MQDLLGKVSCLPALLARAAAAHRPAAVSDVAPLLFAAGRDRDGGNGREGGGVRAGLRGAHGGVAELGPADGGADAGGGQLDWEDQEGGRLIHQVYFDL